MTMPSFNALIFPFGQPPAAVMSSIATSVVAFAVDHHVAVHGVEMTVNDAMIRTRVLVLIGGACRTHRTQNALQDIRCIRGMFPARHRARAKPAGLPWLKPRPVSVSPA